MVFLVLAQLELEDFDLGPEGEARQVVLQVVVGHAQAVLGVGTVFAAAQAQLPGARVVAVLGQGRAFHVEGGRRVAVDRLQQLEAAPCAVLVALFTRAAVAVQAEGGILHQGPAWGRQGLEFGCLQQRSVVGQAQGPLLFHGLQRFGSGGQLPLAGGAEVDAVHQAGVLHRAHGVGGDGGEGELLGQFGAGAGDLQQLQQAVGAVLVEEEVVEAHLLQFPHVLDHAPGLLGAEVEPVFPQVAVLQAAVFLELVAVGDQGEEPGVAAHQAFPGIEDAVVGAFDEGTEVERVAEQGGVVLVHIALVDAQQGVAEHRGGAVEVGRREHQHGAVGVDVLEPLPVFTARRGGQVAQVQLLAQPAGAGGVDALGVLVAEGRVAVQRLDGGAEFRFRVVCAFG